MPLTSSGQLSMREIFAEKYGSDSAGTVAENISLYGMSKDGVPDYQAKSSLFLLDIDGEPSAPDGNNTAPYGISEFYNYSQFSWGTPGSITTNSSYPFNGYQESRSGGDTDYVTACNMTLNTSTKIISFSFTNTDGSGGFNTNIGSTNTTAISYSGDLTSLEARFVYSGENIIVNSDASTEDGRVVEMFNNGGTLSSSNVANNSFSGTTAANDISSGASGTWQYIRPPLQSPVQSGSMSVALAVMTDDANYQDYSYAEIAFTGSDSLKIQLRANGSTVVDLYTRTGNFGMEAASSEEDTT